MKPYTYLIGWSELQKFYYGVRYASGCHPTEFLITYFTSSVEVEKMITQHGLPDIVQIRKTFTDVHKARVWEHTVLRRLKVTKSDKWLNQTDNISIAPRIGAQNHMFGKIGKLSHRFGTKHSEESKKIIGAKSKMKIYSDEFRAKIRELVTGRKHTDATKKLLSERLSGRTFSEEHKKNISKNHADVSKENNPFFGKTHSDDCKQRMKESRKNFKWVHRPETGERTLINGEIIDSYLNNGWIRGKGK
jgi:hypothetical protein